MTSKREEREEREARLREEMALHVDLATEENLRRGMTPAEARRAARLAFGSAPAHTEEARDQFRSPAWAAVGQDVRYALRMARRAPMLTSVAVITLGAAIALATSAFSAVNAVLLRALPYPASERLALVSGTARGRSTQDPVSFTNAMDWRRDTKTFASLATFSCAPRPVLDAGGGPARVNIMEVSSDFFHVLGATAIVGRLFDSTDFATSANVAPNTVVLTNRLWRERFGSKASVAGSRVLLDGAFVTVAGVLSPESAPLPARLACDPDLYRPLASRYDDTQRQWTFLRAIARLGPGVSIKQAQAELDVENARLEAAHPATNRDVGARVVLLSDSLAAPLRPLLLFAQIGALLVLLVACANVATLLLARATARRRELSIRIAMGASRGRLVRQVLTECLLLGAASAVLGSALALVATKVISARAGAAIPDPRGLGFDWRVTGFAVLVSLSVTVLFGLVAAVRSQGDGTELIASLRDGGRGIAAGFTWVSRAVVVAQLAVGMIVLMSAGLLARSYYRMRDVNPGFDASGVMTARVSLPNAAYPRGARQVEFYRQVLSRISSQRGVVAAGAVSILPESPNFDKTPAKVVGRQYEPNDSPTPDVYRVTPGYFSAMRIPLRDGRAFTATDDDRHPLVAIINATMANALFSGERAIGRRIWTGAGNAERTIVGVVGDVYQYGLDSVKTMQLYVPHADNSGGDLTLVVRSDNAARQLAAVIRDAVRAVDPGVPVDEIASMDRVLSVSAARRRLMASLSLIFAIGASGLAALGLYGLVAYSVSRRTQEIGVRMAIGATAVSVAARVLGDTSKLAAAGICIGLVAAALLSKLISPLLFGVRLTDAATLLGAPIVLAVVALSACAIPAIRAARVDPATVLRGE